MHRDAFASLVTHELRNPLNAMSGWLHLLAADPANVGEAAQRAIGGLRRALEQQAAQVDVLGRVLRLTEGADPSETTRVDLGVMLASCADTLRPLAQAGGRTVEVDSDGPESVWVDGNPASIAAALRTFGVYGLRHATPGSALRFTLGGEPGTPSVRVSIDEGDGDGLSVWHGFGGDGSRLTLELLHASLMLEALGARLGASGRGRVGDALVIRFVPPGAEASRGPSTDRPHD